jgi:hypothetical protein
MLRHPAHVYGLLSWSEDKPHLRPMRKSIKRLLRLLRHAPVNAPCSRRCCSRIPKYMTLRIDENCDFHPGVDFWCRNHEPSLSHTHDAKKPIDFTSVEYIPRSSANYFARELLFALGLPRDAHITESFADSFFAKLRKSDQDR